MGWIESTDVAMLISQSRGWFPALEMIHVTATTFVFGMITIVDLRLLGLLARGSAVSALYRDVAPGQYHVTVDSYGRDFNQSRWVHLFPGQQAYFKIVSLRNWAACGGVRNECQRDTFYVWEIPPEIAQGDVAHSQFYGGS